MLLYWLEKYNYLKLIVGGLERVHSHDLLKTVEADDDEGSLHSARVSLGRADVVDEKPV